MYGLATTGYEGDLERCESALSEARCMREADASYGQALDLAADIYTNCVIEE